jgi:hypothetical protein
MNPITSTTRSTDAVRFDPISSWDAIQPPKARQTPPRLSA